MLSGAEVGEQYATLGQVLFGIAGAGILRLRRLREYSGSLSSKFVEGRHCLLLGALVGKHYAAVGQILLDDTGAGRLRPPLRQIIGGIDRRSVAWAIGRSVVGIVAVVGVVAPVTPIGIRERVAPDPPMWATVPPERTTVMVESPMSEVMEAVVGEVPVAKAVTKMVTAKMMSEVMVAAEPVGAEVMAAVMAREMMPAMAGVEVAAMAAEVVTTEVMTTAMMAAAVMTTAVTTAREGIGSAQHTHR